ncbi:unnamed protein product [Linum tenue]|uniref:Oleosin n=3 Tax=Linum tenue TaxID=586396 RepID=A0AAV0K2B1_9ROSI|nr:unnamed protein product [Linum tenue]
MADHRRHDYYGREDQDQYGAGGMMKSMLPERGPSTQQILAVVTLLPLGGFLLLVAGLVFAATLIGLAVATPVFVICSPVIVPAALAIGMAVMGFLTSGAFGITALSSLSWMANYIRRTRVGAVVPEQMEHAKRRAQDVAGQVGQKARDVGQAVQGKAQDASRGVQEGVGSRSPGRT